jgi:sugar phosphate isomerase/epimerase
MPVAIQSNVWYGQLHRSDLAGVLEQIARAGYDGAEIGAHKLNLDAPQEFNDLLTRFGLVASGIHVHGEIFTPAEMDARQEDFEKAARFARAVHASSVIISGRAKEGKSEAELLAEVNSLHRVADICQAQDLPLFYHSHNWELVDDLRELRYLMTNTDPEKISLALDIGWVQRAGYDPLKVIDEFYPRIGYLHLKDTLDDRWTEVGRGTVDFPAILTDLNQRGFFGWLTVERDEELEKAFESAKISRDSLRNLGV